MNPIGFNKRIIKNVTTGEAVTKLELVSEKTTEFLSRVFNSTTEVILEFLDKNAKSIRLRDSADSLYCYDNLLLVRTNGQKAYDLEQNLKEIESLGIAPKYLQYFQLGKDDFLTILDTGSETLLPYTENVQKATPKTKQVFKSKLKELLNNGFTNKEIFANKEGFLVGENGKIIFADWLGLERVAGTKKQALENHLKNWQF